MLIAPPQRMTSPPRDLSCRPRALVVDRPPTARRPSKTTLRHERAGLDLEVRAAHDRMEVRPCGRQPTAAADVAIERRETLLALAVHVVGQLVASLLDGLEEGRRRAGSWPVRARGPAGRHDRGRDRRRRAARQSSMRRK